MIRDDDRCHACHARPARHEDLCDVCEGDAQRSDVLSLRALNDEIDAAFRELIERAVA